MGEPLEGSGGTAAGALPVRPAADALSHAQAGESQAALRDPQLKQEREDGDAHAGTEGRRSGTEAIPKTDQEARQEPAPTSALERQTDVKAETESAAGPDAENCLDGADVGTREILEEEEQGPSRLKFPSYDDFLKEEEEDRKAEEAEAAEDSGKDANLDAAFELFMSEVKDMPAVTGNPNGRGRKEARTVIKKFKSSDEECIRLTCQTFPSPFQVLLLGPEASEDDIRKQYRKLSLLIHPDKCKHPNAQEAFQVVNKAYEQLQRPEMREKYRDVIEEAKRRVLKENAKENKKRRTQSIDVPLLSEDPAELQAEIMEMCEKLLEETRERREYAERTRQANERYEREQLEKQANEELEKCKERKEWLDRRDERVGAWREYQSAIQSKDVKLQAFTGIRHQREERKEDDIVRKKKKMQGIDTSYKDSWR
ncbi:hypothetical protein NCLIV_014920 [Neospora caninum Liverpool]|uniref:DnaJ homolog subfamily C member 8 n=1 Tax=Neospora caninum (strain Liverpool) TaxID=572307 RepID=F0VCK8_NEOCL|nr:hypothetical protein NCLIV_014920 [Neospora caninum Liverpool]CBZ51697.1 hypothetical protein NCLIV_014920 [Neospora caninum Liverpool]CEL65649.1 TPA: DnaJ homolog subfamily C member 8 [Neospora caninum Liverpool]|eukprot:XP_003881730.1 hypothetical protein NCLIV_014920 [Neospora caninum Liverpool]